MRAAASNKDGTTLRGPVLILLVMSSTGCPPPERGAYQGSVGNSRPAEDEWIQLFNGTDLDGWTPKIAGSEPGEDPYGTFRVEDGLLTVGYEGYDQFEGRFGHLFYEESFSHYQLRVEYRFLGEQISGGPDWAIRNSGVMFHSQSAGSMLRDQDFPISLELQFLGGDGSAERPTASLCTPGTHVNVDGVRVEDHCIVAPAPTYDGDAWVTLDLVVLGDSLISHVIDGDTVLTYSRPVVGGGEVNGFASGAKTDGQTLTEGYLALQSESHPVQFRRVLLRRLPIPE